MPHDGHAMPETPILVDLTALTAAALPEAEALFATGRDTLKAQVSSGGKVSNQALEARQFQAHALSWLATYVEALRQLNAWAGRLAEAGQFGAMEALILQIGFGEYLTQIAGGIPMSQTEFARLSDLGLDWTPGEAATRLMTGGNTPEARAALVALMRDNHGRATFGATGLDEELEMIRDQFRRYADEKVIPRAHDWHLKDELIPMEVITELAEMGVFGLTIPEAYGGF
nr:acyl-CoA dehydrogenase family protein [Tabrizicola sp.]